MTKRLVSFFTFLLLLFILAVSEIEAVETAPKLFENPSKTYFGKCNDEACDKKCSSWEGAVNGACHMREDKFGCFCYYNSYKDKSPSPTGYGSPAPPKAGTPPKSGTPSPPKGGSPSPSPSPSPPPAAGSPPPPAAGSPPPPAAGSPPPPAAGSPPPPAAGSPPPPPY